MSMHGSGWQGCSSWLQALSIRPRRPAAGKVGRKVTLKANHFKVACKLAKVCFLHDPPHCQFGINALTFPDTLMITEAPLILLLFRNAA